MLSRIDTVWNTRIGSNITWIFDCHWGLNEKKKKKITKPFKSFECYEKVALKKLISWNPFYVGTKLKVFAA